VIKATSWEPRDIDIDAAAEVRAPHGESGPRVRCMSAADAAAYLGSDVAWLRGAARRHSIATIRVGARVVYDRVDLDAYLDRQKLGAAWSDETAPEGAPTPADVACRDAFESVIERTKSGATSAAEFTEAFAAVERTCDGDWFALDGRLRAAGVGRAPAQELWFDAGRAAASTGAVESAARIGRFLAATSLHAGATPSPPDRPPRAARGLHVLALASTAGEAAAYADMAAAAYRRGMFAPPAEIVSVIARWRRRRRGARVGRRLLDGLPERLAWHEIEILTSEPDEHSAVLTIRGVRRIVTFEDLSMNDGRGRRPSFRWALLKTFARSRGRIRRPFGPGAGTGALEMLVECMRDDLRVTFGIGGDPVRLESDGGRKRAWQCAFQVSSAWETGGDGPDRDG